jgi:predicted HicB family RNase H-like nuclease
MATVAKTAKRRPQRTVAHSESVKKRRDRTLHFRVPVAVVEALAKAANADRRTISAWVANCVEDRLRINGYLT